MAHKVLLVDDDPPVITALERCLRGEAYEIYSASSADEALEMLRCIAVDLVVSDETMPGMSGADLLAQIRRQYPDTVRMMLTGNATLELALRAVNEGKIYHFFTKPWNDADLAITIRNALQHRELLAQARLMLKTLKHQGSVIEKLEEEYPGVTVVKRDESGTIIMDDQDIEGDFDELMTQINAEIDRAMGVPGTPG